MDSAYLVAFSYSHPIHDFQYGDVICCEFDEVKAYKKICSKIPDCNFIVYKLIEIEDVTEEFL